MINKAIMKVEIEKVSNGFLVRKYYRNYDEKTNKQLDSFSLDESDVWEIGDSLNSWTYDVDNSDNYTKQVNHLVWSILGVLGVDCGNKYTRKLCIEWEYSDHHDFKKEELLQLKQKHEEELEWINEILENIEKEEKLL